MRSQHTIVRCPHGLHMRVASQIVRIARDLQSRVSIRTHGCKSADACSILELLTLGASEGVSIEIIASGIDEDHAVQAVADVFEEGGGI